MKILFAISELSFSNSNGTKKFIKDYVKELRNFADVICVYLNMTESNVHYSDDTIDYVIEKEPLYDFSSSDSRIFETALSFRTKIESIIENFKPDVIHCNDRKSYIPFCFNKNVFYSSYFFPDEFLDNSILNELYFDEIKIERFALERSSVVSVYSEFNAKKIRMFTSERTSPIVLPLGFDIKKFLKNEDNTLYISQNTLYADEKIEKKLHVCYFCEKENSYNNVYNFIEIINRLGKEFKTKFNVSYSIFCKSSLSSDFDTSLVDRICLTKDIDIENEYRKTDIFLILDKTEGFCSYGLKAMASGCLVLIPSEKDLDIFIEDKFNCLSISIEKNNASEVLKNSIINFNKYKTIRTNAIRTALHWSVCKSVQAHLYVYRQVCRNRFYLLDTAYGVKERELIRKYKASCDVEKIHCIEFEEYNCKKIFLELNKKIISKKILILTGVYSPSKKDLPSNVEIFSVLNEDLMGITIRPECLPFNDIEFDYVVSIGCIESSVDLCNALIEMQRVCGKNVFIIYNKNEIYSWQTFKMDMDDDWNKITNDNWNTTINPENITLFDKTCVDIIEYKKIEPNYY